MGLRGFLYLADSYRKYIETNGIYLYGSTPVKLPVPQYVVFYNGSREEPDRSEIRLSDLFMQAEGIEPCIEVTAVMLNINKGHNRELMEKCRILWEYAEFIGRIRENQLVGMTLEEAVNDAVESCIRDGILAEFLKAHRAEVIEVVLTEYDEKGYIAYEKKLSREEGHREGLSEGLREGHREGHKEGRIEGLKEGRTEGLKEGHREGHKEGLREGLAEGELKKLVDQVCKKLAKGKDVEQIAEELEEKPETIAGICEAADHFAPDYDCDKIIAWIKEKNTQEDVLL